MTFLYPLLLLGLAAIGLPILLHLIRRHTRQRVTFSSLMFLRSTPPRLRQRSRVEHWLLLAVRCLILGLLALAFARPFVVKPLTARALPSGKRIVVLLDTSASMRRAGLWEQALREVRSALAAVDPADRVCVMTFDRTTRTVAGFDQWRAVESAQTVVSQLAARSPGWAATNLGQALVAAAEAIEEDEANDQDATRTHEVVLISDVQQGSSLEALAIYEWPRNVELSIKPLLAKGKTDATMQLVTGRDYLSRLDDVNSPSVRVTNSIDAAAQRFQLRWAGAASESVDVYVPSGGSAVVKAPPRAKTHDDSPLQLSGDDQDFGNVLYVTPPLRQPISIVYLGSDDPNDSQGLLFYLHRAFGAAGALHAQVTSVRASDSLPLADRVQLLIASGTLDSARSASLRRTLESGRTGLFVLEADVGTSDSSNKYAMLGRMDFTHPLLAPFSDPKFGDFTRIHFWRYGKVHVEDIPGARVIAWFDTNDPAILEIPSGRGSLLMLTFGWRPADSDLALSSKFVPLLYSLLEYSGALTGQRPQYAVGDSVSLPAGAASQPAGVQVRKPDGALVRVDAADFAGTDVPGVYTMESPGRSQSFAVNLAAAECRVDPMPVEDLEKLGLHLAQPSSAGSGTDGKSTLQRKQAADLAALESRQKLWRWGIVAVLGMILMETWLAERVRAQAKPAPAED